MTPKRLVLLSIFLAYALIMGVVERAFPIELAIPGVKLGLGNVVILMALYLFTVPEALMLTALKCTMTAIFSGTFASFLYSIAGALLSFLVMATMLKGLGDRVGPVGVSIAGAVAHNIGQILAASFLMRTWLIAAYLPLLLLSGAVTGVLVGIAVRYSLKLVKHLYKRQLP